MGLAVTNDYNALAQRTVVALASQPSTLTSFGYDGLGRMQTVSHGQEQFSYGYLDDTRLVASMTARHGGSDTMTVTRKYDRLNRLVAVKTATTAGPPLVFGYQYNTANQRIRSALADGSYWAYGYDGLGQVKSGKRLWSDGAPVPGQQFEYAFDEIGNRSNTKAGGDDRGAALRAAVYSSNALNQITSRQVPGGLDVVGIARADAVIEVNGTTNGVYRHAEYFDRALSLDNTNAPVWTTVEVEATWNNQTDTRSGHAWLPQTPEPFDYDEDGNLTDDGRWTFTWDGENRLTRLVARTTTGPQQRIDFAYDWRGRRISKKVWNNTEGNGNPAVDLRFVYDGWNLIVILNSQSSILKSFVWGIDLSGSEQGAGGVGGLLAVGDSASGLAHYAAYDGNGNVAALVQATDGTLSARYEYGPFGETIRVSAPMAAANPIRWSTKYTDDETDLVYYGHRYYTLSTGRWLNRDPLAENGARLLRAPGSLSAPSASSWLGINLERIVQNAKEQTLYKEESQLYLFNANDSLGCIDELGLMSLQELLVKIDLRFRRRAGRECLCDCVPPKVFGSISGSANRDTVTGYYSEPFTTVFFDDCCILDPRSIGGTAIARPKKGDRART